MDRQKEGPGITIAEAQRRSRERLRQQPFSTECLEGLQTYLGIAREAQSAATAFFDESPKDILGFHLNLLHDDLAEMWGMTKRDIRLEVKVIERLRASIDGERIPAIDAHNVLAEIANRWTMFGLEKFVECECPARARLVK